MKMFKILMVALLLGACGADPAPAEDAEQADTGPPLCGGLVAGVQRCEGLVTADGVPCAVCAGGKACMLPDAPEPSGYLYCVVGNDCAADPVCR
jgi:hypothetical protein